MKKVIREVIEIDEDKCTGCGFCIPGCPEGAIKIVDGKARLISDKYCDGLGACLGECPEGALRLVEREAEDFDEEAVKVHLEQIEKESPDPAVEFSGCPGSRVLQWKAESEAHPPIEQTVPTPSQLRQWPVQLMLVNPQADYFRHADLAIIADCVPFAYANTHQDFIKGKSLIVGCPKLDDLGFYKEKMTQIFRLNDVQRVTVVIMEVPCCAGLVQAVQQAKSASGKDFPFEKVVIGIKGDRKPETVAAF